MTEDEMVRWHHQLNEYEFEQAPGVGDRQESLACCNPWGCKEWDMTDSLTLYSQEMLCLTYSKEHQLSSVQFSYTVVSDSL